MKTKANLTQLRAKATAVARAVSVLKGRGDDAARPVFLAESLRAMYATAKSAEKVEDQAKTALAFIEDSIPLSSREVEAEVRAILTAIADMQEALGVPAEQRAIYGTSLPGDACWRSAANAMLEQVAVRLDGADAISSEGNHGECTFLLLTARQKLESLQTMVEGESDESECGYACMWLHAILSGLHDAHWTPDTMRPLLAEAIRLTDDATESGGCFAAYDPNASATRSHAVTGADGTRTLAGLESVAPVDLPGDAGTRACIANDAGIQLQQNARAMLSLFEADKLERGPFKALVGRALALSGVVMSAMGDEVATVGDMRAVLAG